jgi:hypothetical protein
LSVPHSRAPHRWLAPKGDDVGRNRPSQVPTYPPRQSRRRDLGDTPSPNTPNPAKPVYAHESTAGCHLKQSSPDESETPCPGRGGDPSHQICRDNGGRTMHDHVTSHRSTLGAQRCRADAGSMRARCGPGPSGRPMERDRDIDSLVPLFPAAVVVVRGSVTRGGLMGLWEVGGGV